MNTPGSFGFYGTGMASELAEPDISRAEMEQVQARVYEHLDDPNDRWDIMQMLFARPHNEHRDAHGRKLYGRD